MAKTRPNVITQFVRVYWERRLSDVDPKDTYALLSLLEEAYNLGRDDLSYELLMKVVEND